MESKKELLIAGMYEKTAAYPNTKFRIEGFYDDPDILVSEINCFRHGLGYRAVNTFFGRIFTAANIAVSHISLLVKFIRCKPVKNLYVPYPGLFFCFLLSFLPKRRRPKRIILDAFISLYDTVVIDRELVSPDGVLAMCIKFVESRAFKYADIVVTDTVLNSHYLSELYWLPREKFLDIPLATDEMVFKKEPYVAVKSSCNILFIGTMVPLHGIKVILDAIDSIKDVRGVSFTVIGSGQEQYYIEEYTNYNEGIVNWVDGWQSSQQLYEYIKAADICLGIFDDGVKAQRVCPFKLYMYAACGKPIVTAETEWTKSVQNKSETGIFETVKPGDSADLAKSLYRLSMDASKRFELSFASADFYKNYLSNDMASEALKDLLV